jgi:ADP-ribosyl-[dinitrogen reductase] hydrolase
MDEHDRFRGSLAGLAAGDALGTTLEFQPRGSFTPVHDIVGGGPFKLTAGEWTDDTSMALCLAESLIECRGFNAHDQMTRYVRWWQDGHLSSNGTCFDIGITTSQALQRFRVSGDPFAGSTDPGAAGNGSLMRLAPIALAFNRAGAILWDAAAKSSMTTHATQACLDACGFYASLIALALQGQDKQTILSGTALPQGFQDKDMDALIVSIARGSYKRKNPPKIRGTGYVVEALEASLWAFYHADSFEEGALMAVNLGDDADTTGAIYGQLAGAYYGYQGIPQHWRDRIARRELINDFADALFALSQEITDE